LCVEEYSLLRFSLWSICCCI